MDGSQFDHLTRRWATRRSAISGLIAGLSGLVGLDAEAKRRRKKPHPGTEKRHQPSAVLAEKKKKKKKCKGGTLKCGKVCVNASTDAQNCGTCGNACGGGRACVGGACQQPPSTGTCPTGQIRCGGGCVDTTSDEAHCGGCGQACQGDLTCLSGTCGCADTGDTKCGNLCVDTQTDDAHCGTCDIACASGQTCRQGACSSSPCGVNERDCGGSRCIPEGSEACCSQEDCGGFSSGSELVCRNDRCVCREQNEGICRRVEGGGGICDVCCGDGSHSCRDDLICNSLPGNPDIKFCDCPPGKQRCQGIAANTFKCQNSVGNDQRRCGQDCLDCDIENPGSICCNGRCIRGCDPNEGGFNCQGQICENCQVCPFGQLCCNAGLGKPPVCVLPGPSGACPGPNNN